MRPVVIVAVILSASSSIRSQTEELLSFEVVSIKPATPALAGRTRVGCTGGPGSTDPISLSCSSVSLADILFKGYDLQPYQLLAPDWTRSGRFDINAKLPASTTREQLMRMAQGMLVDRFRIKVHREQRQIPGYELGIGRGGPKLKEVTKAAASSGEDIGPGRTFKMENGFPVFPAGRGGLLGLNGHFRWTAFNVTMGDVLKMLVLQLGAPVINATGLKGKYDIDLYWVLESVEPRGAGPAQPDTPAVSDGTVPAGPLLRQAIQDQLGLKLGPKKAPVEVIVVDHAERVPVGN